MGHKVEVFSEDTQVEVAGYVSANKKIAQLLSAGVRLNLARKEQFDTMDTDADIPIDPTRAPGVDMADISRIARETSIRLARQVQERKRVPTTPLPVTETPPAEGLKG